MKTQRVIAILLTAALPALLGGCSQQATSAAQNDGQPVNAALKTPPIHLRQTGYYVKNGHPYVETVYKQLLAPCQKLEGTNSLLTVSPIRGSVVDKLGRTYYDIWFQGTHAALRSKSWGFTVAHECQFQTVSHTRMAIANGDGAYTINLDDGTATHDASSTVVRNAIRPQTAGQKATDAKERAKVIAALKKHGYAGAVDTAPSEPTPIKVAGQPCAHRHSATYGDSCVWTGGEKWGFRDEPSLFEGYLAGSDPLLTSVDGVGLPGDVILLSNTPPDGGNGTRLTTQTMTVGKPFDAHVFEVAPNISVQPTGQ